MAVKLEFLLESRNLTVFGVTRVNIDSDRAEFGLLPPDCFLGYHQEVPGVTASQSAAPLPAAPTNGVDVTTEVKHLRNFNVKRQLNSVLDFTKSKQNGRSRQFLISWHFQPSKKLVSAPSRWGESAYHVMLNMGCLLLLDF